MATIIERLTTTFTGTDVASLPTYSTPTPLNLGSWSAAYWAEDPLWTPPASGSAITTFRDGTGAGQNLGAGVSNPLPKYYSTVASLNGKPGLTFTGTEVAFYDNTPNLSQTWSMVLLASLTSHTATNIIVGNSTSNNGLGLQYTTTTYRMNNGVSLNGGAPTDAAPHLIVGVANSTTSKVAVDGTTVATGDAGTGGMNSIALGGGMSSAGALAAGFHGNIGFLGVYQGDVTAAVWWSDFKAYCALHYNMTIA